MLRRFLMLINRTIFFRKKSINPARRIVLSFALIILLGALFLMLPVSSKSGEYTPFFTSLFTSTSATCVTGLVLVDTGAYYSYFGQAVILVLIQVGGLGFMSVLTMVFVATKRSIGLRDRLLIVQSLGLFDMSGVVRILKHVMSFTFLTEAIGAVLLSFRFVPEYGFKGIWYSVFHSVSAFCNAGFDVLGFSNSLENYSNDAYVLIVISILIIFGGLGFIVVEDIRTKKSIKRLSIYSKIVLIMTIILIIGGTVGFLLTEWSNEQFGNGFLNKFLSAYFQSVTTRTAGFDSVAQGNLTDGGKMLSIILMMTGGASGSTAGGLKVATVFVIIISSFRVLQGHKNVVIFGRKIEHKTVLGAMSLMLLWIIMVFFASIFVSNRNELPVIDSLYEVTSAYGTVGLTVGVTASSDNMTRLLLIIYMFFGRVGIMTISMMFMTRKRKTDIVEYPEGNIIIG